MGILRLLGLAFIVTLIFSGFSAGSASALLFLTSLAIQELFTLLNLNSAAKPARLETKAFSVACESVLGDGLNEDKTDLAKKILLTLSGCEAPLGGKCQSAGEPEGVIKTLELDALLVTTLNDRYGILLLGGAGNIAEFNCVLVPNVVVRGSVVGEVPETLEDAREPKEEFKVIFAKGVNAGEPAIKDYWTLTSLQAPKLEVSVEGGKFEGASLEAVIDERAVFSIRLCHEP